MTPLALSGFSDMLAVSIVLYLRTTFPLLFVANVKVSSLVYYFDYLDVLVQLEKLFLDSLSSSKVFTFI